MSESKISKKLNRTPSIALLLCCFMVLFISGCGGRKRPPPTIAAPTGGPTLPTPAGRPTALDQTPKIRVLLKENFVSARIVGSDLAPLVVIRAEGDQIHLRDGKGRVLRSGSGFRLKPLPGRVLKLEGVPYQEVIEVFINPLGQAVLINELSLETYLRGVVPNEVSSTEFPWTEGIKTLAIAARTFAFSSLGQNAVRGFDLYSDSRSQVYRGIDSEQPLSNRSIDETWGIIATYRDKPIVAFYSSTCGGLTEDYGEVFQKDPIPYLQGGASCPDSSSPYHSWDDHISVSRIQKRLDRWARVGKLRRLEPIRKSKYGRTVEMRFVGNKGEKILKGLNIRSALGLRSTWITDLDAHYDSAGYIVEIHAKGRGWGHGVGLCQIGALELAEQGWSFERILKHYYKGIELTRRW